MQTTATSYRTNLAKGQKFMDKANGAMFTLSQQAVVYRMTVCNGSLTIADRKVMNEAMDLSKASWDRLSSVFNAKKIGETFKHIGPVKSITGLKSKPICGNVEDVQATLEDLGIQSFSQFHKWANPEKKLTKAQQTVADAMFAAMSELSGFDTLDEDKTAAQQRSCENVVRNAAKAIGTVKDKAAKATKDKANKDKATLQQAIAA